jgi:predicted transcriptional regulator
MRKTASARRSHATPRTAKDKALAAVEKLPANATLEDAIERLVFLAKIDRGLVEVESGKGIEHSEVKRRLLR